MAKIAVAPLVGAWIEIPQQVYLEHLTCVAPLVGAWIEICYWISLIHRAIVAPLVGAWIEICEFFPSVDDYVSLPSWERGLK